jgi:hypothetical protein
MSKGKGKGKKDKGTPAVNVRPCGRFEPSSLMPIQCKNCTFTASAHAPSAR